LALREQRLDNSFMNDLDNKTNNKVGNKAESKASIAGSAVILLMQVRSTVGFIPAFGQHCAQTGIDITSFEECRVNDTLYLRVEVSLSELISSSHVLKESLSKFLEPFDVSLDIIAEQRLQRLALVLGTHTPVIEDIIARVKERRLVPLDIAFIAAMDVDIENTANRYGIPFFALPKANGLELENKCTELNKRYRPDLLGIAGIDHVFSAPFHSKTKAPLFGVQSGFVPAVSGSPKVQFDFEWARQFGARIMLGSSFFYSAKVEGHAIIEQQAIDLSSQVNSSELKLKQAQIESSLFLTSLTKIADHRVLRTANRCIVF
jgi:formyltetrahydrofolate hydrolase